jgi:sugar phosphate permease
MKPIRSDVTDTDRAHKKTVIRLIPFLFVCYIFAYIDRINIGFAKLQMSHALGLSDAAFGLAASIFFVGYVFCEIPSNLLMARIGARRTFGRILILWGLASAGTSLVQGATSLYVLRLMLGVFEAGLAPGILLYLTLWFGPRQRGGVTALFLSSAAIAGVIGSPATAFVMVHLDGVLGLMGWQWMFIAEGLPPVVLGLVAYATLPDCPAEAHWLNDAEKLAIASSLEVPSGTDDRPHCSAFRDPVVYALSLCYFGLICGVYAMTFWLPTIIASAGETDLIKIGLYGAVPYVAAVVSMYALGRRSDARKERIRHTAFPAALASILLVLTVYVHGSFVLSMIGISLATACIYSAYGVFWTIPSDYFSTRTAPGGLALVNTIGLLGGLVSPFCIGLIKQGTGSLAYALLALAAVLLLSTFGLLALRRRLLGNEVTNISTMKNIAYPSER